MLLLSRIADEWHFKPFTPMPSVAIAFLLAPFCWYWRVTTSRIGRALSCLAEPWFGLVSQC